MLMSFKAGIRMRIAGYMRFINRAPDFLTIPLDELLVDNSKVERWW